MPKSTKLPKNTFRPDRSRPITEDQKKVKLDFRAICGPSQKAPYASCSATQHSAPTADLFMLRRAGLKQGGGFE